MLHHRDLIPFALSNITGKCFSCISAPSTAPQFLKTRKLSDYKVELSWQPPLEANSDILFYIVRVWNETFELEQNVTGTSVVINVDSESRYNASVSSWTRLGDGGVLIHISFTTTAAEPFDPPQNVTLVNVTASSVTLMWYPPTEPNGIIVHFTIYYSYNNSVAEKRVPVSDLPARASPDSPFVYTLTGLIGGYEHTLWMTSNTIQGDGGVQSEPLTVFLPEDAAPLSARLRTSRAPCLSCTAKPSRGSLPWAQTPTHTWPPHTYSFILWISRVLSPISPSSLPTFFFFLLCVPFPEELSRWTG
ncbi:phosphatidylinositol phosphatase PTPRQ-like [Stegastes partitus]|uniref:Phosphatidylinositol phosphatase PTPRQ-like n=1 Tax=Stegastes partitus TaxID=144197 RepID=A0A9Y4JSS7_9TELE|nr:PREDICTED: phosphatidylinositol phosphatase PTPRQ-like [Stegastes partitus]